MWQMCQPSWVRIRQKSGVHASVCALRRPEDAAKEDVAAEAVPAEGAAVAEGAAPAVEGEGEGGEGEAKAPAEPEKVRMAGGR
jgi:hypothetical protein